MDYGMNTDEVPWILSEFDNVSSWHWSVVEVEGADEGGIEMWEFPFDSSMPHSRAASIASMAARYVVEPLSYSKAINLGLSAYRTARCTC